MSIRIMLVRTELFALALGVGALGLGQTTVTLKGSTYNLWDNPIALLDGPCDEGAWSSGTDYHALMAVSNSGTWYRAVKASGPGHGGAVTPGTDVTVWIASGNNLSGSGAKFTCLMWGTAGSGKAQAGNPAYVASKAGADAMIASTYANQPGADINWHGVSSSSANTYAASFNCALQWVAEGAPDTSNYLDCALNAIRHAEDFFLGAVLCDETMSDCGQYFAFTDYDSYYSPWLATIYSIVHDKLTSGERTTYNNKIWNDNQTSRNGLGLNGAPTSACTPPVLKTVTGTISTHSWVIWHLVGGHPASETLTVTGVGTHFTTELAVDDIIYAQGHVASITDDTHLQLYAPAAGDDLSGATFQGLVIGKWVDGNNTCGLVWWLKHHPGSPPIGTGTYATSYPTTGGTFSGWGNLTITKESGFLPLAYASAQDDARGRTALTQYFDYYFDNLDPPLHQEVTGFMRPRGYTSGRSQWMLAEIIHSVQNGSPSYNSTPLKGIWVNTIAASWPNAVYNDATVKTNQMPWAGDLQDPNWGLRSSLMAAALIPGTTEANLANYWQKTTSAMYGTGIAFNPYTAQSYSQQSHMLFIYSDPGNAGSGLPATSQYIYDRTDLNPSGGPSASVTTCSYNYAPIMGQDCRMTHWVSHSDFTTTGTTVHVQNNWYDGADHQSDNGPPWMAVEIQRQQFLLSGDGAPGDANYAAGRAMIEITNAANWATTGPTLETRWAGAHPAGVTGSKYAYGCADAHLTYVSTVTTAQRCIVHLKGGSQDYVFVYDYVAVPSGTTIKSHWPFYIGADAFGRTSTANVASWAASKTATVTAAASSLIGQGLLVAGVNTLAAIDEGTGSGGRAKIEDLCASTDGATCSSSATAMEALMAFKADNTTSPSMPTITQPSAGSNWTVAQIADSSTPKVGAFARGTTTQTSISFTSTHSGTAQYLIAGLTAGTYDFKLAGSTICASVIVPANDNTLYCESASGAITVVAAGGGIGGSAFGGKRAIGGKAIVQ